MSEQGQYLEEGIRWGARQPRRAAVASGMKVQSLYIPMPDGVRLAVDLCLPDGLPAGARFPTLLYRTRYWRASELREASPPPNPAVQFLTSHGYAVLRVDVRGTGASFGTLRHEWQPEDTRDAAALVDWILAQPWSDGRVGGYGVSYAGTTAELLAETCHPAVRAVWATYFELDGYLDIAFPGGVPSQFVQLWGQYTAALDRNISPGEDMQPDPAVVGVKPVDGDEGHTLLQSAVLAHSGNRNAHQLLENVIYRDDPMGDAGETSAAMAVYARRERIEASGIPIDIWGSWMDANTADTVLRHFATFRNPQRAVISAWSHGGDSFCSPFLPPGSPLELSLQGQFTELLRFMDQHLLGLDRGIPERMLYYYTLGEEKWKASPTWPLPGSLTRRLYFRENFRLEAGSPAGEGRPDRYQVDFSATTGQQNRWWTEMGGAPVIYADRELQDRRLLVYESQPLEADLEITGYPVVSLQVSSTASDGAFFIYLEAVDPDGRVVYLTEGVLRALHRRISLEEPPYRVFGPYHSFKRRDGEIMIPGQVCELRFALCPISTLVRGGHRLRVAIAGADASTFARLPEEGEVEISLHRSSQAASWIELPVIPRA